MTGLELPAVATAAGSAGMLPTALQGVQMLGTAHNLFGPQGAIAKGDIMGAAQGISGLANMFSSAPSSSTPTTQSLFGLDPMQFSRIPPEVRQELLRKAMGR